MLIMFEKTLHECRIDISTQRLWNCEVFIYKLKNKSFWFCQSKVTFSDTSKRMKYPVRRTLSLQLLSSPSAVEHDYIINENIFRATGPLWGEWNPPSIGGLPSQRPLMRRFDIFFDLRLNKQMSKRSRLRWFGTPSCSSWRHSNE